jgi:multicomponent Na+:H+ antiporter subunit D
VVTGNLWVVLPLACLAGGAFVVYLIARLGKAPNGLLALATAIAFAAALTTALPLAAITCCEGALPVWGHTGEGGAFLTSDPGSIIITCIAVSLGLIVVIYSGRYLALDRRYETYYPLLLLLVAGLVGMVMAGDLFNLYMFCELMSISAYTLVSFRRHTDTAVEAGFKYLIIGSVGTAIVLMGISFVYRGAGHLTLSSTGTDPDNPWVRAGLACFLVGFGIKSAMVPLHTWLPDAHGRAPSSISAMLSGIVIQSTFYALLKISLSLGFQARSFGTLLIALSLLNMTLGNGLALVQTNTKRMLAYSTIAQMGYVILSIGIGLRNKVPEAIQAGFFVLLGHAVMKGLAFLCKGVCHFYTNTTDIPQLRGTARQMPLVAVSMSLSLAGLAAVPPLAGFAGKWLILTRILNAADLLVYVALAIFLVNGLLSLGYYLPTIGTLFASPEPAGGGSTEAAAQGQRIRVSLWMAVPIAFLGGLVLAIGLYPVPWLGWTEGVGTYLLALSN